MARQLTLVKKRQRHSKKKKYTVRNKRRAGHTNPANANLSNGPGYRIRSLRDRVRDRVKTTSPKDVLSLTTNLLNRKKKRKKTRSTVIVSV